MLTPYKVQVRFSDIDMLSHVNNAVYLNYFESARIHYLSQIVDRNWNWKKQGIILKVNEIEYILPVFLDDNIEIKVYVEKIGTKSFSLVYELYCDQVIKTVGKSVLVSYDFETNSTTSLPDDLRQGLQKLEQKNYK